MKVVILAGGFGTRLKEETSIKPKPMVEVGGKPILWHIMKIYAGYGFTEFIVALGYKGDIIKNYFLNYYHLNNNLTISLRNGIATANGNRSDDWIVDLVDTGLNTKTGGRIRRLKEWLKGERFMMTYGDGVSDIDIVDLIAFHERHRKLVTMTVVRPPARFGNLQLEGGSVSWFVEKPQIGEGWINGGFFVIEPEVLEYITGDEIYFEREPLETLARKGEVAGYRHEGFWQCVDTLRDLQLLEDLWATSKAPWRLWP